MLVGLGAALAVCAWIPRSWDLDFAERLGLSGLLGLAAIGWLIFPILLVSTNLLFMIPVLVALFLVAGIARKLISLDAFSCTKNLWVVIPCLALLLAMVTALAPSTAMDWDTLAYHLAVPKLWLEAGHMTYIPFIHHSNFPFLVDNLFVLGLRFGGESGAKAFTCIGFGFGLVWIFGVVRRWHGECAARWATILFAVTPVILWESGTGYVDVIHGLFAAAGAIYAVEYLNTSKRNWLVLTALLLGAAMASKYTGLQTFAIVGIVLLFGARKHLPTVIGAGVLALVIASPWYIRNTINTGNPLYPFFYEQLGGKDWDQRRANIYRIEQKSFGVKTSWGDLPHAVAGLAYQPGRYVNPAQTIGLGNPMGAVGAASLVVLALAALSRRRSDKRSGVLLAIVGMSLVLWFALSQQSRYIVTLVPMIALLFGSIRSLALQRIAYAAVVLQALITLVTQVRTSTQDQLRVVLGQESRADYLGRRIPFALPADEINKLVPPTGKVALYDEVFGYLLDVPYEWANPGHSTRIPYDSMANGDDYVARMKKLGFTHVYVNLRSEPQDFAQRWLAAMGLGSGPMPFEPAEREAIFQNWEIRWKVLIAEAAVTGNLKVANAFSKSILFELNPDSATLRSGRPSPN